MLKENTPCVGILSSLQESSNASLDRVGTLQKHHDIYLYLRGGNKTKSPRSWLIHEHSWKIDGRPWRGKQARRISTKVSICNAAAGSGWVAEVSLSSQRRLVAAVQKAILTLLYVYLCLCMRVHVCVQDAHGCNEAIRLAYGKQHNVKIALAVHLGVA